MSTSRSATILAVVLILLGLGLGYWSVGAAAPGRTPPPPHAPEVAQVSTISTLSGWCCLPQGTTCTQSPNPRDCLEKKTGMVFSKTQEGCTKACTILHRNP